MTGSPLDLTPFGPLLSAFGLLYGGLALVMTALALGVPRRWWVKVPLAAIVLAGFTYPVAIQVHQKREQRDEIKAKLAEATALFQERCKSAGEKVTRTVENVEGLLLMNIRPTEMNYAEQFRMDDPYGRNCGGDDCIALYLFDYKMVPIMPGPNAGLEPVTSRLYAYVDVDDVATGQRFRYAKESAVLPLTRKPALGPGPRYGVAWADISTRSDREHWIAGGSIKVVDVETKEVIAERTGFLIDTGQGSADGGRSPWPWARSNSKGCPPIADHNQTFVSRVLKPKHME